MANLLTMVIYLFIYKMDMLSMASFCVFPDIQNYRNILILASCPEPDYGLQRYAISENDNAILTFVSAVFNWVYFLI